MSSKESITYGTAVEEIFSCYGAMPLTSKDDVFRLDTNEKIQLLLDKKNIRETKSQIEQELRLFVLINRAVNGSEDMMNSFLREKTDALNRIEIAEKLKKGFKGKGKLVTHSKGRLCR